MQPLVEAARQRGDAFVVESRLERVSPVRVAFVQDIARTTGGHRTTCVKARVICAAMNPSTGRPIMPPAELARVFNAEGAPAPT